MASTQIIPSGPEGATIEIGLPTPAPAPEREYTKAEFRALLTLPEQLIIDNFNVAEFAAEVPAIQALTVMQRAHVRTGIETYNGVTGVLLSDPRTERFVSMLAGFGLLESADRAYRILAGLPPQGTP